MDCLPKTLFGIVTACATGVAAAPDLSGTWELQSLGADRTFTIQHKDNRLVVHRVMWPEFEGEKYKLEHLYRGNLKGEKISGQLLVKEEELPKFEVLRDFRGVVRSDRVLLLDGLPLKRVGKGKKAPPNASDSGNRATDAPPMSQAPKPPANAPAVAQTPKPSEPQKPSKTGQSASNKDSAVSLFESIMGAPGMNQEELFKISAQVVVPNEAAELTASGDALYEKKKYKDALAKYDEATHIGGVSQVLLLHKIGRCHLALRQYAKAVQVLRRALKLDPNNQKLRKDYSRAKAKV